MQERDVCSIEKVLIIPFQDDRGKSSKGIIITNKMQKMIDLNNFQNLNFPIAVSDSTMCEINRLVEISNFKDYTSNNAPAHFYEYELITISSNKDTLYHKVINKIPDRDFLKNVLDLVEFDNLDTLKEQKKFSLEVLRSAYDTVQSTFNNLRE
jgi:hypothetical protein